MEDAGGPETGGTVNVATPLIVNADPLIPLWSEAFTPPPVLTVSEWADANRILPQSSAAVGAHWRTSHVPYLRGIMDAVHEPSVRKIAVMKAAQVGGSEAIGNIIGFCIEHDPAPIVLVQPSDKVAEEYSKERLADMIRSTPALAAAVDETESTLTLKMFPGGFLVLGGANSPNTFARRAARLAIGDDVDRFPAVVGQEGDPVDLLEKRTATFDNGLTIYVSTPTLKHGRIDTLFERSDQRRYHVRCPRCGRRDWMTWADVAHFRVGFNERDPSTARLECPSEEHGGCGSHLDEIDRRRMVAAGEWVATVEIPKESGLAGFHLPAMVTTLGNASLATWVDQWLAARVRGKESLRVFINTTLAESWEDRGARMNPHILTARREDYGHDVEVPWPAVALTAGVDVQDNRFEIQVQAWGLAFERWVVDWRTVPGDPKQAETQASLLDALTRKYAHASGHLLPIHATCLDTGYASEEMYSFVLAHQVRRIFATKGIGGKSGEPIVGKPSQKRYGKHPRPVLLYPVNVDDAKADIMSSLALPQPDPGESAPGYTHFPAHLDTVDDEYFAQLCAEHRRTVYNKAGVATHTVWELDRERNEALDTAVLCLAAFKLLNPNIRQMQDALRAASEVVPVATERQPPTTPKSPPQTSMFPGRRATRSAYLGR